MARVKVTSTDIYAKLAKGECANYAHNGCQGRTPCTVINGEECRYFAEYVKPLLEYPEFSSKYGREAKITVALNPKAKVVRKRHTAALSPRLELAPAAPEPPAKKLPDTKTPARKPARQAVAKPAPPPPVAPVSQPAVGTSKRTATNERRQTPPPPPPATPLSAERHARTAPQKKTDNATLTFELPDSGASPATPRRRQPAAQPAAHTRHAPAPETHAPQARPKAVPEAQPILFDLAADSRAAGTGKRQHRKA